ncbi:MAG: hypothetical protein JWM31_108 [Solirubrobacterales bacterium]|nr:hypothetical protein [Solirubrobacterales bacterium]
MIVKWVFDAVAAVLTGLLSLIPAWAMPAQATANTAQTFGSMFAWANGYAPIFHILAAVGVVLGFQVLVSGWTVLVWVYDRIPFKAT